MGRVRASFFVVALLVVGMVGLVAGCGGGGGGDGSPNPPAVTNFTHSPLSLGDLMYIQPLGNLNPPGHTFPTDHIAFYFTDPLQTYSIYAPAAGTIVGVFNRTQAGPPVVYDYKLEISHGGTLRSYLDHVGELDPEILAQTGALPEGYQSVSVPVTGGQRIGSAGGRVDAYAVDFGSYDTATTLPGFIHPEKYPTQTAHCTSPLSYYTGDLRASLYGHVRRSGEDKDGKIDFDVPGKLVGNWFSQGATADDWTRHLSFVYDPNEPSEVRIGLGGELGMTGAYEVPDTATDPAEVSAATGKVAYTLWQNGWQVGLLIAQVTGAETIRVEVFPSRTATDADFTEAARVYTR
jgi:hypothetical protein